MIKCEVFLRRCEYGGKINLRDFSKGLRPTVLGRQLEVIEYEDDVTIVYYESLARKRTLGLVTPDEYNRMGEMIGAAQVEGLDVERIRMLKLTPGKAEILFRSHPESDDNSDFVRYMTSDVVVAVELSGDQAVGRWKEISVRFKRRRSFAGEAGELDFFFASDFPTTALFNNCTLCLIKPHAVRRSTGAIISLLLSEGFEISAMETFSMSLASAEEFLEVYKGVASRTFESAQELSKGPLVAMELRQEKAVQKLRDLAGPPDPAMARQVAKDSLRAKFGEDEIRNAIHCTDLEEDAVIECEFFFKILKS